MSNILKPNNQRSKNAITLIWIVMAAEMLSLASGFLQYDLLQTVLNGEEISQEAADYNDLREQIIGLVYLVVYVTSAVTFIQWFRRAYFNLQQMVKHLSYDDGWAAGCWFVPIVSIYRPFQIMKELYVETKELLNKHVDQLSASGRSLVERINTSTLGWWWAFWLLTNLSGQFTFRYSVSAESIEELITSTTTSMALNLLGLPLGFLAIKVVHDYSLMEPLLLEIKPLDAENQNVDGSVS